MSISTLNLSSLLGYSHHIQPIFQSQAQDLISFRNPLLTSPDQDNLSSLCYIYPALVLQVTCYLVFIFPWLTLRIL